jgi:hypothetical protein
MLAFAVAFVALVESIKPAFHHCRALVHPFYYFSNDQSTTTDITVKSFLTLFVLIMLVHIENIWKNNVCVIVPSCKMNISVIITRWAQ